MKRSTILKRITVLSLILTMIFFQAGCSTGRKQERKSVKNNDVIQTEQYNNLIDEYNALLEQEKKCTERLEVATEQLKINNDVIDEINKDRKRSQTRHILIGVGIGVSIGIVVGGVLGYGLNEALKK